MDDLQVTLIQTDLIWEDSNANLKVFDQKISQLSQSTDLIVLPEMFNTGFSMRSHELSEPMDGPTIKWMQLKAKTKICCIAGSLIVREKDRNYNRFIFTWPDGKIAYYNKRHLFRMAEENQYFSEGDEKKIVELKGWKINLQICYDLRFPVWSRNQYDDKGEAAYDALIYVANWPKARINAWDTLLQARAIENQCYTIGLNRIGYDGKGIEYNGHSKVVDSKGNVIESMEGESEKTIRLSYDDLSEFRKKFPVGLDAD